MHKDIDKALDNAPKEATKIISQSDREKFIEILNDPRTTYCALSAIVNGVMRIHGSDAEKGLAKDIGDLMGVIRDDHAKMH